jgi:hypothetical protein
LGQITKKNGIRDKWEQHENKENKAKLVKNKLQTREGRNILTRVQHI